MLLVLAVLIETYKAEHHPILASHLQRGHQIPLGSAGAFLARPGVVVGSSDRVPTR